MNSKKALMALSAAVVLAVLGTASAASASDDDRDRGVSATQAQRDWVEWQRSLGRNPGNASVDNSRTAYGFVAPHAPRAHVRHGQATVQRRTPTTGYSDYGYAEYGHRPAWGEETYIGIQDQFFRDSN